MRFGRRRKSTRPPPGEYPRQFTEAFVQATLPTETPAQAHSTLDHLRSKGWTEEELAEKILPYMPRRRPEAPTAGGGGIIIPGGASKAWLDQQLPSMDRHQMRLVVDELERRGWSPAEAAVTVLPHLLPKLSPGDREAILAGLRDLGLTEEEITSVARVG